MHAVHNEYSDRASVCAHRFSAADVTWRAAGRALAAAVRNDMRSGVARAAALRYWRQKQVRGSSRSSLPARPRANNNEQGVHGCESGGGGGGGRCSWLLGQCGARARDRVTAGDATSSPGLAGDLDKAAGEGLQARRQAACPLTGHGCGGAGGWLLSRRALEQQLTRRGSQGLHPWQCWHSADCLQRLPASPEIR